MRYEVKVWMNYDIECFGISSLRRLVFSRFLDLHGKLGNVKEKPTLSWCQQKSYCVMINRY